MTEAEALRQSTGFRRNSWKALLFVLPFLRPHLRRMILVSLIDISIVLLNLALPWFGKSILDSAIPQRNWSAITTIAVSVAGILLVVQGLTALRTFLYNTTEMLLGLDLRKKMYGHLQKLSLDTVESLPVGEQQFRVTTDSDRIAHMLVRILPTATMLVEFALILSASIFVDKTLTLIVLMFLVPWTILFIWVTHFGRILDRRRLRCCEIRDAGILQASASFASIKSLGRSRRELRRNGKVSVAVQRVAAQGYLILVGFEFATQKLIPYLKTTTVYLLLARKVVTGQMTLGTTVPMIAYLGRLTYPIERIVNFGCWIWQTMVSAERMMQILQVQPAIQDRPDAKPLTSFTGKVSFEKVTFERPGIGRVLNGIDFTVSPGKTVAIVGPSGAGKSTIVSLALRLIDPLSGRVLIDGQDLTELDRNSYLQRVGTVMQETFLFSGTLAENLLMARPEATEVELTKALGDVELGSWLASLPNGLHQDLENGLALSAGQRQRIGIARAILTDSPLLILDEPTSALDAQTERDIMATVKRLSQGRATILVTHRLETAEYADEIVVLDLGEVVERGTHEKLMENQGLYARLQRLYRARANVSEPNLQGVASS